jgi:hypothetical protein
LWLAKNIQRGSQRLYRCELVRPPIVDGICRNEIRKSSFATGAKRLEDVFTLSPGTVNSDQRGYLICAA